MLHETMRAYSVVFIEGKPCISRRCVLLDACNERQLSDVSVCDFDSCALLLLCIIICVALTVLVLQVYLGWRVVFSCIEINGS